MKRHRAKEVLKGLVAQAVVKPSLWLINKWTPKSPSTALFFSHVPRSDNARALFEYVLVHYPNLKCTWLTNDWLSARLLQRKGIRAWPVRSLQGLGAFLRSRYVFTTHPFIWYSLKSRRQVTICLWHGMPLKAMGFMDKLETPAALRSMREWVQATDVMACASSTMKNAMVACCAFPDSDRVLITGQPRSDLLMTARRGRLLLEAALGRSLAKYKKLIAYLPTIKRGYQDRVEGQLPFVDWDASDTQLLADFLAERQALMIVKFHPLDEARLAETGVALPDNVALLSTGPMLQADADLYELLGAVDVLVTDYSSVYFDYLLLQRPILFMVSDLHVYQQVRGFALEPIDFWLPGPKVATVRQLTEELDKLLTNDEYWRAERAAVNLAANAYQDANSCERICKAVLGECQQ